MDLPNYATKADMKGATDIDTYMLASKAHLAYLKTKVDNVDAGKLLTVPADLSKLSNVVDSVAKKTVYDRLVAKVSSIDTKIRRMCELTQYDPDRSGEDNGGC